MYERGWIWGPASKMKKCRSQTTCHQRHDARPGFLSILLSFSISYLTSQWIFKINFLFIMQNMANILFCSQTTCHQRHDARPVFLVNNIIIFNVIPHIAINVQNKYSLSSCKIWVIFYFVSFELFLLTWNPINVAEMSAINKYDQGGEEAGTDHNVVGPATPLANTKMIQLWTWVKLLREGFCFSY